MTLAGSQVSARKDQDFADQSLEVKLLKNAIVVSMGLGTKSAAASHAEWKEVTSNLRTGLVFGL